VVFEGLARLRWAAGPWRLHGAGAGAAVLDHVWPRRGEQAHLRRQIDHGQRTVVVIDDGEPVVTLPLPRAPHIPFGAVDVGGAGVDARRLSIPRFSWLRDRDRTRGEGFLSRVADQQLPTGRHGEGAIVIERSLLGTAEPLRFVFAEREMSLGQLQLTIEHMFRPQPPLAARPAVGARRLPVVADILAA
jgi:hypothetical protein